MSYDVHQHPMSVKELGGTNLPLSGGDGGAMFKNYLKTAIRNILKNKVVSFINITGLSLGMAGAVLLILNIQYELSFDQFHQQKNTIFKAYNKDIVNGKLECWSITPPPLAPALKQEYPEIKEFTRVAGTQKLFSFGNDKLKANGNYVDPSFLRMFSFPLVNGNMETALADLHSIVITEEFAKKMFGDQDPVNKIIRADNADNFTVTGVIKNPPYNTAFRFEYLIPWEFLKAKKIEHAEWDYNYVNTYVQLEPTANLLAVNSKISNITVRHTNQKEKTKIFLYPLTREHLYGRFENGQAAGGNIDNVRMLGILAGAILLIACINFMNLSTARSEKRAKEVGVRKVIGANKRSLVFQFIGESILLAFISGVMALGLVDILLPAFSSLAKVNLTIVWTSPLFWIAAIGFILLTGILAGSYPSFYLSSFKPIKVLKGVLKNGNALVTPRKILVVVQFVFSIFLINFTIVFHKQISHEQNRELGFVKENLLFHPLTDDLRKNYSLVKNELLTSGTATSVSKSTSPITWSAGSVSGLNWPGQDPKQNISFELVSTSGDFIKTNGLTLIAGRDIDVEKFPTDTASCLINETAVRATGLKNAIGQSISGNKIVGVVKDYLIGSPKQATPAVLITGRDDANFLSIRLNSNYPSLENLENVENILKRYNPNFLTEYQFADTEYASKFKQSKDVASLMNTFTLIIIFISCMGLFGLAMYIAENRTKEIGIRKVLGASVARITSLLAGDFIKLVMIAVLIASPLAWLFMTSFIRHFEYRTDISWWILIASGSGALFMAILTISFQSVRAAIGNPIKSLRTE
ncbi:MAG TPA: ABC transporter permease [Flavitalea sp.]|nr:ABC transporter permease [Flavitalea sp.]